MDDAHEIWRLGRWIARRTNGAAHLRWSEGEVVLRVSRGKMVSVDRLDPRLLAGRLGCRSVGNTDLLEEARALASEEGISETVAMGAAKEVVQEAIRAWLLDPHRELELVEGDPDEVEGPAVSVTHAIVELVLSETEHDLHSMVLPDTGVLLRRGEGFLDLYAPLRLSEEADLIVAKITGQRTAEEIATRSPHGPEEVKRLLAALVATGMLEPVPVVRGDEASDLLPDQLAEPVVRRRLPPAWIVAALAAVALLVVLAALLVPRLLDPPVAAEEGGRWTVVVDMGCELEELERVHQLARDNPSALRAVPADPEDEDGCWWLVWGRFQSQEAARKAVADVPPRLLEDGFEPQLVELPPAISGAEGS